jgi:hypothetical protein
MFAARLNDGITKLSTEGMQKVKSIIDTKLKPAKTSIKETPQTNNNGINYGEYSSSNWRTI